MKDDEIGRVYAAGEIIFREGDEGTRMYVVQSGKVRITRKSGSGDITIASLESGEIFGEMALFDRLPRSASAIAIGEARVLSIDKQKLFQAISRDPTLVFKVVESMSRRIRRLDEEFSKLKKNKLDLQIFVDVDETCNFVLGESRHFVSADNGSIMIIDKDGELSVKAAFGIEWWPKISLRIGEGIAGDVLRTGKSELVNDISMDARYKTGPCRIKSLLCVPLKGKNNNLGVINMSKSSNKLFSLEDLKSLKAIAMYASIAIENALNFKRLGDATDEILSHASMLDLWY